MIVEFRITIAAFDVLGGRSYGTGSIPRRGWDRFLAMIAAIGEVAAREAQRVAAELRKAAALELERIAWGAPIAVYRDDDYDRYDDPDERPHGVTRRDWIEFREMEHFDHG